jgi:hypothetical protein
LPDADGYGYSNEDRGIDRLLEDMRTLSPAGIERIAAGWDANESTGLEQFHAAEKAALKALETADLAPVWENLRRRGLDLTEGRSAMVDWKAEHGDTGHKAERAALGAALALLAGDAVKDEDRATLRAPMAEALPWLKAG